MRGSLMRLFTKQQHVEVLELHQSNVDASAAYSLASGKNISPQLVRYWRTIFLDNGGKLATADHALKETRILRQSQPDDDLGDTSFLREEHLAILVIPDQHAPYQHKDAIRFLKAVKQAFNPDLVVNLGDELDYHSLSFHDSDPNLDSAGAELEKGKIFLRELARVFPNMLVCHSNHGSMVYRRAKAHGIPTQMIKRYRDTIAPVGGVPGWSWAYSWKVGTPLGPVMFKHQATGILTDAAHNGCNLVVGHNHGNFSIEYSASSAHLYWGGYAGCLIDKDALAFAYGKHSLRKPIIGCMVILNGRPTLIPMILDSEGRWIGSL